MKKVSNNLYRGVRPRSFEDLKLAGITTSICLQSGVYEAFHDDLYEKQKKERQNFGVKDVSYGMSDFTAPTWYQLKAITEDIRIYLLSGEAVYIHCLHGKDRTGSVVFAHRVINEKWPIWKALIEMFNEGFHWIPYILWVPKLVKNVKRIKSGV